MQPVTHHPLLEDDTTAALLRLSRSMLDHETSPTSNVSDDEDEADGGNINDDLEEQSVIPEGRRTTTTTTTASISSSKRQSAPLSPTLRSLQWQTAPSIPDEQDRKRFVGCLATVLASAYDYDVDDDDDKSDRSSLNNDDGTSNNKNNSFDESLFGGGGGSQKSSSQQDKMANIRRRRRKRRYTVLSKLLLSSAELLQVDKGQARAFLPMLSKLLMPNNKNNASQEQQQQHQSRKRPTSQRRRIIRGRPSASSTIYRDSSSWSHEAAATTTQCAVPSLGGKSSFSSNGGYDGSSSGGDKGAGDCHLDDFLDDEDEQDLFFQEQLDRIEHIRPFLESMTPGAGFRCLSMFLLQHLLHSPEGYDARVRHSVKVLGVILLVLDMTDEEDSNNNDYFKQQTPFDSNLMIFPPPDNNDTFATSTVGGGGGGSEGNLYNSNHSYVGSRRSRGVSQDRVAIATRKFEALEHYIATKLLQLSQLQQQHKQRQSSTRTSSSNPNNNNVSSSSSSALARPASTFVSREQVLRGLKIGGTAVVAGTLFAVTGGLAAPGIAAGVAALAGGTAAAAAATAVLTCTAAVTAIFGVGGGSLAAYKMQRRTQGLTEFEFHKESGENSVDLFLTVAISGWLRDKHDFQRPWGVTPTNPRLTDRLELLERFYAIHSPDHVTKCKRILQSWEGEEEELWRLLAQKYGRDPSHLFPVDGPRHRYKLTLEQHEAIDQIFVELGYVVKQPASIQDHQPPTRFERVRLSWRKRGIEGPALKAAPLGPHLKSIAAQGSSMRNDSRHDPNARDSLHGPHDPAPGSHPHIPITDSSSSVASSGFESLSTSVSSSFEAKDESKDKSCIPKHVSTVWDYTSCYGGELYTVKWEGGLMIELCDSVADLAFDLVGSGTAQILKHTALSSIMSAIAWPYALVNAANLIDGTWTLAVERSDEAGRELARSLLFSRAGHRPVTLVGFSFGARTIYACLKELARYQEKWENFQESGIVSEGGERGEGGTSFYNQMREPASIVEDAILMGLPNHLSSGSWTACRQVVAGRLVNCFSQKDLVLSLMFQFKRLGLKPVCGTCPVNVSGVENIDVTDLVSGHQDYCIVTGDILERVRHGQPFQSRPTHVAPVNTSRLGRIDT